MSLDALLPTQRAYAEARAAQAGNSVPFILEELKSLYATAMKLTWEQEGAVGPEEIFESLGGKGAALFSGGESLLQFILSHDPSWNYPRPSREYTINEDGTVTIHPVSDPQSVDG